MPNKWNKKKRKVKETKSGLYKYKDVKKEIIDGKKTRTVTKGYSYPVEDGSYSGSEITTVKTKGKGKVKSGESSYGGVDKPDPGYKWQSLKKGGKIRNQFKEQYD